MVDPNSLPAAPAYGKKPDGTMYRIMGTPGQSAYQVAVRNGFIGTEQEWLESLMGPQGPEGPPGGGGGGGGGGGAHYVSPVAPECTLAMTTYRDEFDGLGFPGVGWLDKADWPALMEPSAESATTSLGSLRLIQPGGGTQKGACSGLISFTPGTTITVPMVMQRTGTDTGLFNIGVISVSDPTGYEVLSVYYYAGSGELILSGDVDTTAVVVPPGTTILATFEALTGNQVKVTTDQTGAASATYTFTSVQNHLAFMGLSGGAGKQDAEYAMAYVEVSVPDAACFNVGDLWIDPTVQAVRTQVISYTWNALGGDMSTGTTWTAPSGWAKVMFTAPCPGVLVLNAVGSMYCRTASGEYIMRLAIADVTAGSSTVLGSSWGRINNVTLTGQHPVTAIGSVIYLAAAGHQCSIIPQGYTSGAATWALRDVFMNGVFYPHAGYIALTGAT